MQQCLNQAHALSETGQDGTRFERKKVGLRLQFIVKNAKGQILALGNQHSNETRSNQGVRTIISLVQEAVIVPEVISESR